MQPAVRSSLAFERLVVSVVFTLSFVSMLAATWLSRTREGWDSASYMFTVMPLSVVLGAACGWAFVRRTWRWPITFAAGQFAALLALSGGGMSLWPLTIAIVLVLALPCWGAAALAAWLRKRKRRLAD